MIVAVILVIAGVIQTTGERIGLVQERSYATAPGQRATVTLTNGDRVTLGPETVLQVTDRGAKRGVTATITGEALFTVSHRDRGTFTVRSGNTFVRVLGTVFSVRRYGVDLATRVVVADGRVSVGAIHKPEGNPAEQILTSRMAGVVTDSGAIRTTADVSLDRDTAWTTGRLVFERVPVRDVVAELGRAYDVNFRVADSVMAALPLTWTVPTNTASLQNVLTELSEMLGVHFTRSGRSITIMPGRSATRKAVSPPNLTLQEVQYGR
jgi:transmembrane sensor